MALTKLTTDLIDGDLGGGTTWVSDSKTANFTAVAGKGYFDNTTSAAVTVTLPSSPTAGDEVSIVDYAGTADTNNINITSSDNINGSSDDVVIDYERGGVSMVYVDATQGWIAYNAANETATALVTPPGTPFSADYLVVAGGGGGGRYGGGGGAGGFLNSSFQLTPAISYTITAGAGGAGHVGSAQAGGNGASGSDSSISGADITTVTSYGGGGGGNYSNPGTSASNGANGGSGGGGGRTNDGYNSSGGYGTAGQGNHGGGSSYQYSSHNGGGGGGAGATGASGVGGGSNGAGGAGASSSITGTATTYAGGGAGSALSSNTLPGGSGGGGTGYGYQATATTDADGDTNTGGGGGGTSDNVINGTARAGNGGSGIVILRYPNTYTVTIGAGLTGSTATDGSDKVTTFTAGTGTISFS